MKYGAGGADGENSSATIPGGAEPTTKVSKVGRLRGKMTVGGHKDVCHTSHGDVKAGAKLPSKRAMHAKRR